MQAPEITLPVLVVGAGAWGSAIAVQFSARAADGMVTLWARDGQQVEQMTSLRENKKYLPGIALPRSLGLSADLSKACANWRAQSDAHRRAQPGQTLHALIILATPMSGLEQAAALLMHELGAPQAGEAMIWLAKGLALDGPGTSKESTGLRWPHQILESACPGWPMAALSGPSFAQEVARGLPAALTVASRQIDWARHIAQACHGAGLRLYPTDDLIGVELGGAMKNVLAIAAGVCDGLALGANARAALLTRGLAEMSRVGIAIGAREQTFMGLASLGDLLLTATGDLSRNRRVGLALARGERLDDIVRSLGHVAEGVKSAPALQALADSVGVDVPITGAVCGLLSGQCSAAQAIASLTARDVRDEFDH